MGITRIELVPISRCFTPVLYLTLSYIPIIFQITFQKFSVLMISGSLFTAEKNLLIILSGGKRGTRTPLLQGQYGDLWTGLIYSQLPLSSQVSKNLISGSGGIRTHLLINHYADLSRGRFYGPLALHSHIFQITFLWPRWGSNPQSPRLKGGCFTIQLQGHSLCSHWESNPNP